MERLSIQGWGRTWLALATVFVAAACSFSSSSAIAELIADHSSIETCGPIWSDSEDPVALSWVLSYGPPVNPEVSFVGSMVRWEEVHYDASEELEIETYLLRGLGWDETDAMFSSLYFGVTEYENIAATVEQYGERLPAQYVSEPGEGVILLGVARPGAAAPSGLVVFQATRVDFSMDGVDGSVTPPDVVSKADLVGVPKTDPDSISYCEPLG